MWYRPFGVSIALASYDTEFATAEATYSRLLTVLINQLKQPGTP